jgi:predicted anti-sigma-YlaC factor YlaD
MIDCRTTREALPEYVAGRWLERKEEIEEHLSMCEACNEACFEMKAVFDLLEAIPEPAASPYAEANAGLALRSLISPGPLRSMERQLRRETIVLGVCSFASFAGTAAVGAGLFSLYHSRVTLMQAWRWAMDWLQKPMAVDLSWPVIALIVVLSGLASLLPAILLNSPMSPYRRRLRKEL